MTSDHRRTFGILATVLLVAWGYVFASTRDWIRSVAAVENQFTGPEPAADREPAEPTIFLEPDSYYWITYARQVVETGAGRIRWTFMDNTPYGREVHYSSLPIWMLAGAGRIHAQCAGGPPGPSVAVAARWLNPFLLFVLTTALGILALRFLGILPTVALVAGLVTLPGLAWTFHPFRPDSQAFHVSFFLLQLVLLTLSGLGWVAERPAVPGADALFGAPEPSPGKRARHLALAAGVAGGAGLWIGATAHTVLMSALVAGAAMAAGFRRLSRDNTPPDSAVFRPNIWRLWSRAGALSSLAFYLAEYFPSHLAMRLEVNHPLYALAWFCGGELLARFSTPRTPTQPTPAGTRAWNGILYWAGVLALPAALVWGPPEWHHMRDPVVRRLHEATSEHTGYIAFVGADWLRTFLLSFGWLPLGLPYAGWSLLRGRPAGFRRDVLLFTGTAALALLLFMLAQSRWVPFFAAACLWLVVVQLSVGQALFGRDGPGQWILPGLVLLLIHFAFCGWSQQAQTRAAGQPRGPVPPWLLDAVMQKEAARALADKQTPVRVLCDPDLTAALAYFGGAQGVASYFWENAAGIRAAAEALADMNDQAAARVFQERGLTRAIMPQEQGAGEKWLYLATGSREAGNRAASTLAARLSSGSARLPAWLTPAGSPAWPELFFRGAPVDWNLLLYRKSN